MADNDALDAALAQFNEGLKLQQAEETAKRAVDKAERKKQQAASELKKLQSDPNASGEDKAAADEAYRTAVDEFNKLRSGDGDDAADDAGESDGDGAPESDGEAEAEASAGDGEASEGESEASEEAPTEEPDAAE